MKRKTVIIEQHEVWIARKRTSRHEWCDECSARVWMLTPEDAALMTSLSPRLLYQWIEAGRVHFIERPDGSIHICLASIMNGQTSPHP